MSAPVPEGGERAGVTLVVPVYGTPELVRKLVDALPAFAETVRRCGFEYDGAIIADDGSPNGSEIFSAAVSDEGRSAVAYHRTDPNRGKGFAVKSAALSCPSDFILMSDADLSAPLGEFASLAAALAPDVAMVCGIRRAAGTGRGPLRRILSRIFNRLARIVGADGIADTQCGFKLFRMSAMRPVFERQRIERFAFDVELIRLARRAGWKVAQAEVDWHGGRRSTLHVLGDGARMLYDLLRVART